MLLCAQSINLFGNLYGQETTTNDYPYNQHGIHPVLNTAPASCVVAMLLVSITLIAATRFVYYYAAGADVNFCCTGLTFP